MTALTALQAGWDQAASEDAMYNILTDPARVNSGWDPADFFAHGESEIDAAFARYTPAGTRRALDFGCGLGRLTLALAQYFKRVDGVDISEQMITRARDMNKNHRVWYHHNPAPDLALFADDAFDFVYSMLVLQHMPQDLQYGYVREFFRVLKPGGTMMFEIPDGPDIMHPNQWLSMYGVPRATVEEWITGTLVDVELIDEPSQWACYRYTVTA